jgi:DnaJ-class molecular chaperone
MGAKRAMDKNKFGDAPGKDVYKDLRVTLEEAVLGVKMPLTYTRERVCGGCEGAGRLSSTFIDCDACGGAGLTVTSTSVEVTVPAGVTDGATLRLKEQGGEGKPNGELYVKVAAAAMNQGGIIRRNGADLYTDVPIVRFPVRGEATSIRVRTVEGEWGNLAVAADAEAGAALRIRGRGAPLKPGGGERGDHLFVVKKVLYEDVGDDGEADETVA